MKGAGVVAALGCVACCSGAGAASSSPPLAPLGRHPTAAAAVTASAGSAAAATAPRGTAFVGGLPWGQRRQQRRIGGAAAAAPGRGAAAVATPSRRRQRAGAAGAPLMRVDVEVKAPPRSSSGNEDENSGSGSGGLSAGGPPPAPRDSFRHKSLAAEPTDYGPYLKLGSKYQINAFGVWFGFWAGLVWAGVWAVALLFQTALIEYLDKIDPMRRNVDFGASTWGRLSCLCTGLTPEITGIENIPEGPAVFVANHASWMDVPYSALLPVHCKYLAKSDLAKVPVLGDAMSLARHVLLDRENKRSQMEALSSALKILKRGTPIFVFPEGTRGPEGRLQAFKMGAFKVASKAGVPIVPVSIAGTHLIMPREVIMPQRSSNGIAALHVHPPIPSEGRTDKELADLAFDVINDALSDEQRSLRPDQKDSDASPM